MPLRKTCSASVEVSDHSSSRRSPFSTGSTAARSARARGGWRTGRSTSTSSLVCCDTVFPLSRRLERRPDANGTAIGVRDKEEKRAPLARAPQGNRLRLARITVAAPRALAVLVCAVYSIPRLSGRNLSSFLGPPPRVGTVAERCYYEGGRPDCSRASAGGEREYGLHLTANERGRKRYESHRTVMDSDTDGDYVEFAHAGADREG